MTIHDVNTYADLGALAPEPPCNCGSLICDTCGDCPEGEPIGGERLLDLEERGQ